MSLNRRQVLTGFATTATAAALVGSSTATASSRSHAELFPTIIQLPDNWLPEGIAIGVLPFAYFGSRADGSIYRANLITGAGRVLPTPGPGTPAVGLKLDRVRRLFVAGGNARRRPRRQRPHRADPGQFPVHHRRFVRQRRRADRQRGVLHRYSQAGALRGPGGPLTGPCRNRPTSRRCHCRRS